MIKIKEFMTTEPYTLPPEATLNDAREIMTEKHFRHIPVTDNKKHLLGLITQRDVLAASAPEVLKEGSNVTHGLDSSIKLEEVMIRNISIIHPDDSLRQAARYLQTHKYGCLPVVADGELVGIITDTDFIAIAINLLEQVEISEEEIGSDVDEEMDFIELDEAL